MSLEALAALAPMKLVDRTTTPDGCHEWAGSRDKDGYGRIKVNGRYRRATHVILELAGFLIPYEGLGVLHRCDNPPCCREDHLKIGTREENQEDKVSKGRQALGEHHGQAKLDSVKVRKIRRLYAAGGTTQEILARQFGVSLGTVSDVLRGKTWRHVAI